MMQIPIVNGIYTDTAPNIRTAYPRNFFTVAKTSGISKGYLRPADGLVQFGAATPGPDRGGIVWNGQIYRVCGSSLIRVSPAGLITILGDVGNGSAPVRLDYSPTHLGIVSAGRLYFSADNAPIPLSDPDAGLVLDAVWCDGYWLIHNGSTVAVTDLSNPFSVNPLKYGSAESDPDPVVGLRRLRREVYVVGQYTTEVFRNRGGNLFPFSSVDGAQVPKGAVGPHAICQHQELIAIVGRGRNESVSVYLIANGQSAQLSTREIDQILSGYDDATLATVVLEPRVDDGHDFLYLHLPDRTLVYDHAASVALGEKIWNELATAAAGLGQYRARGLVTLNGRWYAGDPAAARLCVFDEMLSSHYGQVNGWEFSTLAMYAEAESAIVHELELVALTGRAASAANPTVWTSYSVDGLGWSVERPIRAGAPGDTLRRLIWLQQGALRNWRIQRFRGNSDAHIAVAYLDARLEPLNPRHDRATLMGGARG